MSETVRFLSLGAGVQSSTLALMAGKGEIQPPTAAIFADTGDEPAAVYEWLRWLTSRLPFPVVTVRHKSNMPLSEAAMNVRTAKSGNRYTKHTIPVFMRSPEGGMGLAQRYCTLDFKVDPIRRYVRSQVGKKGKAIVYIGISRDEVIRMKPSQVPWIENRWPLIDLGMTRKDCLAWMEKNGYPTPPRSACVYCPYHSDAEWRRLKTDEPEAFQTAVDFEKRYQIALSTTTLLRGTPYLHRSGQALETVDFDAVDNQMDLVWGSECEGMCGV